MLLFDLKPVLLPHWQGIDLIAGGRYVGHKNRTAPRSDNVYLKLLVKVRVYSG